MNIVSYLESQGIAKPPKWLGANVCYLTRMGSEVYGCQTDDSDVDVYGFCVPLKEDTFPHLRGEIMGFGRQIQRFEQYQEHHLAELSTRKVWDLSVYSIVKYFHLAMENNPNIIDSLFTDRVHVVHSTAIAEMVRERRRVFLHKGAWQKFKGYAYSQLAKMNNQQQQVRAIREFEDAHGIPHDVPFEAIQQTRECREGTKQHYVWAGVMGLSEADLSAYERLWQAGLTDTKATKASKRFPSRKRWGYDVKFAAHLVRLVLECEQLLTEGDIDLGRKSEILRDVRSGNWTELQVREWFQRREKEIDPLYTTSTAVPHKPDEDAIKALLLECLEHHYGSLDKAIFCESRAMQALREIKAAVERAGI